ncbi:MAG: hypothetical protein ACREIC_16085, partial [Limisphaerales bacterium]
CLNSLALTMYLATPCYITGTLKFSRNPTRSPARESLSAVRVAAVNLLLYLVTALPGCANS